MHFYDYILHGFAEQSTDLHEDERLAGHLIAELRCVVSVVPPHRHHLPPQLSEPAQLPGHHSKQSYLLMRTGKIYLKINRLINLTYIIWA